MVKVRWLVLLMLVGMVWVGSSRPAMAAPPAQEGRHVIHVVEYGEDIFLIADRYGVPVPVILRANGLSDTFEVYVGMRLLVPFDATPPTTNPAAPPVRPPNDTPPSPPPSSNTNTTATADTASATCGQYHTIQSGETLSGIAAANGVTLADLDHLNGGLQVDLIYTGQSLCMAGPDSTATTRTTEETAYYHTVAEGETLINIALTYGVGYLNLKEANDIDNPDSIFLGQRLLIPGYQPPAPATEPTPETEPETAAPAGKPAVVKMTAPVAEVTKEITPTTTMMPPPLDLPRADEPVTILVNDGQMWLRDQVYTEPDPENITTLIVRTADERDPIIHVRNGGYEVRGQSEFIVTYIAPAGYEIWVEDPEAASRATFVEVEAGMQNYVEFDKYTNFEGQEFASPDGWVLLDWHNPSKLDQRLGGWSNIVVKAPASGLRVMAESEGGGYKAACMTGSKGPGTCDLAGLNAGLYTVWIDGTDFFVQTYMDGNAYAEFVLAQQPEPSQAMGPK